MAAAKLAQSGQHEESETGMDCDHHIGQTLSETTQGKSLGDFLHSMIVIDSILALVWIVSLCLTNPGRIAVHIWWTIPVYFLIKNLDKLFQAA